MYHQMNIHKQNGFTLVEIAIVLIIIGLLLGSILKGQELINSARVRNLADQSSGVQAAYYGFVDRYRQVPGDWGAADATAAIGATINTGGNGNGRIDNTLEEAAAVWEQLAKANFLGGGFTPAASVPTSVDEYSAVAPRNAFNGTLVLTRNDGYNGTNTVRLNLHLGGNVPVNIARELDVKIDDGLPNTGVLRLTDNATSTTFNSLMVQVLACTGTAGNPAVAGNGELTTDVYSVVNDNQDCVQAFLY